MADERRVAARYGFAKLIFVSKPGETRGGLLVDISESGAQVELLAPMETVTHSFTIDDEVELVVDDLGMLPSRVTRAMPKHIALEFHIDGDQQRKLVGDIKTAFEKARDRPPVED